MDKLLEYYGAKSKIALRFNVSRAYVSQWFAAGKVPPLMAVKIEKDSGGELKAVNLVEGD